jgi:hypothetical protein
MLKYLAWQMGINAQKLYYAKSLYKNLENQKALELMYLISKPIQIWLTCKPQHISYTIRSFHPYPLRILQFNKLKYNKHHGSQESSVALFKHKSMSTRKVEDPCMWCIHCTCINGFMSAITKMLPAPKPADSVRVASLSERTNHQLKNKKTLSGQQRSQCEYA